MSQILTLFKKPIDKYYIVIYLQINKGLSSMFYNMSLIGNMTINYYWSSSIVSNTCGWDQNFGDGYRGSGLRSDIDYVRCFKEKMLAYKRFENVCFNTPDYQINMNYLACFTI